MAARGVDVAFTAASARAADVAVVIDALRATSTIAEALAGGYRQVRCVDSLDRALELRGEGRVLAGERHCIRPPGFDLGNSPAEMREPRADELVLATTNGAPAIVRAAALAPRVLIGCLRNLAALVAAGLEGDVLIVCAGTDASPSVEDTYVAGRIVAALAGGARPGEGGAPSAARRGAASPGAPSAARRGAASPGAPSAARRTAAPVLTDAATIALSLSRAFPRALDAFSAGAGARALVAAGLQDDIAWCAQESALGVVPVVVSARDGEAVVRPDGAVDVIS